MTTTADTFQGLLTRIDDALKRHEDAVKLQYGLFNQDVESVFTEIKASELSETVKEHLGDYFAKRSEVLAIEIEKWMEKQ